MLAIISTFVWLGLLLPSEAIPHVARDNYEQIKLDYLGIHWDDAKTECSTDQFNMLVEGTRMALEMAALPANDARMSESSAWNRYFVKDTEVSSSNGWHNAVSQLEFDAITKAIKQASIFPRLGKRNRAGKYTEGTKISYHCKELIGLSWCRQDPKLIAYTNPPGKTNGYATVFCPKFFTLKYVNQITDGPKKQPDDMMDPLLTTIEHSIIHEWFHSNVLGTAFHIQDVVGNIPGLPANQSIYGPVRCNEYAWAKMQSSDPLINIMTAHNADNHAWFISNYWFAKKWGWTDDGRTLGGSINPYSQGRPAGQSPPNTPYNQGRPERDRELKVFNEASAVSEAEILSKPVDTSPRCDDTDADGRCI